jgi:hypothetical protein
LLAGVFACVFGILGIFVSGILFVPLAVICSVVGLWRGIAGRSPEGIGTSLLGGVLSVIGFAVSPTLWLLVGALFLAHEFDSAKTSPVAAGPITQETDQDTQFASNLETLVQRMRKFDGIAEADMAALPAYSSRMQTITEKMTDYLRREQELRDDPDAAVARGQLSVAVNQGDVATNQVRIQEQSFESQFQTNEIPFMQLVSTTADNCRAMMQTQASSGPRAKACNDVLNAMPEFAREFQNLQSSIADFDAIDARTQDTQQQLVEESQAAE